MPASPTRSLAAEQQGVGEHQLHGRRQHRERAGDAGGLAQTHALQKEAGGGDHDRQTEPGQGVGELRGLVDRAVPRRRQPGDLITTGIA